MSRWFCWVAPAVFYIISATSLPSAVRAQTLPRLGAGLKFSTLGTGIEAGAAVSRRSNFRAGFNAFRYDYDFSKNGIDYGAQLQLQSVEAHYDWFAAGGFHLSPGLLIYNGNRASGTASVAPGQSFTLGGNQYFSDSANPIRGTATIDFNKNKVSPLLMVGFGNLLPRNGRRFSVNVEGGVALGGSPSAVLNLSGVACTRPGVNCLNVSSFPQFQSDVQTEQNKINTGAAPYDTLHTVLRVYPVISLGVGYRFR